LSLALHPLTFLRWNTTNVVNVVFFDSSSTFSNRYIQMSTEVHIALFTIPANASRLILFCTHSNHSGKLGRVGRVGNVDLVLRFVLQCTGNSLLHSDFESPLLSHLCFTLSQAVGKPLLALLRIDRLFLLPLPIFHTILCSFAIPTDSPSPLDTGRSPST
jgi:hypothetical protein